MTIVRSLAFFRCSSRRCQSPLYTRATRRYRHQEPDAGVPTWPHPIFASSDVTLLKSRFQAYATIFPLSDPSPSEAQSLSQLLDHLPSLNPRIKRATHCMYAWRLSSTAFHASDGGEAGAGDRLLRLLELGMYEGVVVVVYRWFGGVHLGSARWKCITGVAKDALSAGGFGRDREVKRGKKR
ncbi:hypothetical protein EIP91_000383 [Steccherinum ochraceum]|uniref:Impact N-terminal domain-containing protein n=1 Tax=Steccherinum ochraceum TaxID=92696 RepID=A0A4V2MWQ8_9APHY|nr:hypothetical protein EIP91_000383 [Steccherinum ochraceum]